MASDVGESTEKESEVVSTTEAAQDVAPAAEVAQDVAPAAEVAQDVAPAAEVAAKVKPAVTSKGPTPAAKTRAVPAKGKRPAPKKSGFSLRNVLVFGGLVALLLAAFGVLGNRDQGGPNNAPKWKLNEPVDVEITLVASDANDLGCAMEGDVKGLHCAFSTVNAKHPAAGTARDDEKLLQPYSTTNKQNFLAAGVWQQVDTKDPAALDAKVKALANPRFSLTCKFTPRERAKTAKVQWKPGSDWGPGDGWFVGDVKDCKLAK